jgi:hypothetical protein
MKCDEVILLKLEGYTTTLLCSRIEVGKKFDADKIADPEL